MHNTFRVFKYSSTNKYIPIKRTNCPFNSQNSISNEIIWYHFFAEKNRTIQMFLTSTLEVKLEIENIDCTSVYLIDYINLKETKNFSTNINENIVFVSFVYKIEKKFQVTFYSNYEANIFNETINKIIFGTKNNKENIYKNFTTKMFEISKCDKKVEIKRRKKYIKRKIKEMEFKFVKEMEKITNHQNSN